MKIITKKIHELIPYENNPRINDDAVKYVAESIKNYGWKVPVVIDKNNVIIAGHTRTKAAELLGIEDIPCIVADDLTEEQAKAFRLADNKTGEMASWDNDKLREELKGIEEEMKFYGFEPPVEIDLDEFFDEEEEKEKQPKTVTCPECGHTWEVK